MNEHQQQELEEERLAIELALLKDVANGNGTEETAKALASELGILNDFLKRIE